ncbi:hypothetical protein [Serratia sp. P2ACOL2]|nr:hypothetical protein [Serratia sp. P2ACOL2]
MRRPRNYKMLSEIVAELLVVTGVLFFTLGSLVGFVYLLGVMVGDHDA